MKRRVELIRAGLRHFLVLYVLAVVILTAMALALGGTPGVVP
jgi:hypothetical protein